MQVSSSIGGGYKKWMKGEHGFIGGGEIKSTRRKMSKCTLLI